MWFLIFSGFLAWTGKPVTSSCVVEIDPPRAAVRYGNPLLADCKASSDQLHGVGWESSLGGVSLTPNTSSVTLNITAVTQWKFKPQCYATLNDGDQCIENLHVTVFKMPDSVSLAQPTPVGPLVEGKQYRLRCDIVNVAPADNLSVHWVQGNKIVHLDGSKENGIHPVDKSFVVDLTASRNDNGSQIWCEAKLNFWSGGPNVPPMRSKSYEMTVLYPPTFTSPDNEIVELQAASKLTLKCAAAGNPAPAYSWDVPHSVKLANKDLNLQQAVLMPSIHFPGVYNCTASNSQGTKTKSFTVTEVKGDRTMFAALVGGITAVGVLLLVAGLFFVTPDGTFSCIKGDYLRGQPTSSGPV